MLKCEELNLWIYLGGTTSDISNGTLGDYLIGNSHCINRFNSYFVFRGQESTEKAS
jgi:hypothetical protein